MFRAFLLPLLFFTTISRAADATDWQKAAVVYEVYPRSYQDSNGDGIGDLNGITSRLDYLKDLGVDAIWISPMFPSPNADFGYDVSDYEGIDPQFGTMADFDRLSAEAQKRGLRIILDGVFNHSSEQHPWFVESRSSRDNPKRNWYVWRDGKPGGLPPNNWMSGFSHGPAWELDPKTGQYYYHNFFVQQPDLNWRSPDVRKAIYDVIRFWFNKGVSGFRLDAMQIFLEDEQFRDNPPVVKNMAMTGDGGMRSPMTNSLPANSEIFHEMRKVSDEFPGRVLIGENYLHDIAQIAALYGKNNDEVQWPMNMTVGFLDKFDAAAFRAVINDSETKLNGNLPFITFDNHDKPRSWDRYGDGAHNDAIARIIATMLMTTRCAAQLYEGQEIGMVTTPPKTMEESRDPQARTNWPKTKGRDGGRTPMQWDTTKNAGFTTGDNPWIPVPPNYSKLNVETESKDPGSLLNWYKKLISLRKTNAALHVGAFTMLLPNDPNVLAYSREADGKRVVVACNFSAQPQTVDLGLESKKITPLAVSPAEMKAPASLHAVTLEPFAAWTAEIE